MNEYDIARSHIAELHRKAARVHQAEQFMAEVRKTGLIEKCRVTLRWRIGYVLVRLGRAIAGSAAVTN